MKKILLSALVIVLAISLIVWGKFTEGQKSNNISSHQKPKQTVTNTKTDTLKGKDLKGAQFDAVDEQGRKLNFQIKDVELDPQDPEKETYLYTVFYLDRSDSKWKNLCTPDAKNVAKAIPLSGFWDKTGAYIESTNLVTFGCTSGVTAKCVRWGYKPWKNVKGKSLRDFHQACTRMARADYCGNGKPHTREGTLIYIYDVLDIQNKGSEKGMVFEAAWGPDGASCINRPRWFETLSEIRKQCPEKLTGRINENGSCATDQKALQNWPNSLLFNDSLVRKP
ncbi:MAG: hypothetical protein KME28_25095 [Pelatocladus maniniholoensis HA4357-MV3]|jgi:uncharacterized protein YxeA|uniref:ADYC domain-containing protein n=1 Tax=Pelatocladus maniniholoensis HA4357-MV3 TaxID=1117104 RepID=A0A9E3HC73_9NOST|nr:hypothetical protein [Pelatocladus maniniholoensis HA4357-MV3]